MSGSDSKLFARSKVEELRAELQAGASGKDKSYAKRKIVLKRIVASMTMGTDLSSLMPDVIACLNIQVLEIKKMLMSTTLLTSSYLINYSRSKPDMVQYALEGFQADCSDRNPLIRALAIRTMGYIHVPVVIAALLDPLRHALKDTDPYVRKTAAICVAKLYAHDRKLVEREDFVTDLRDLLADSNPTVVANAVAALMEISERSDNIQLRLNMTIASKLVTAMQECSEWGQSYIIESLMNFVPQEHADAELLAERISIRLQHANSAVVMATIKVIMYLLNYMGSEDAIESMCRKLGPPLVTLLSSGYEVQYVALRNILMIVQRRPSVLRREVKVFFCKYNDPIYVKLAKLEIMYRLATESNYEQVLAELAEYATEVDVDFVRKAVRSIGRIAIKLEAAADRCVQVLLDLVKTRVNYVVQEVIVVVKDILRRYSNRYERVIAVLCEHLDALDSPEAKAAMIWIVGQYADRIENADELLEDFLLSFLDESGEVQLALLTATVKLFILRPTAGGELLPKVLKQATEEVDNPDLRDRGFQYWRMLSTAPTAARDIVLGDKPSVSVDADVLDRSVLDRLLLYTGTLASIYHQAPESFIRGAKPRQLQQSPALDPEASRSFLAQLDLPRHVPPVHVISATSDGDGLDAAGQEQQMISEDAPVLPPKPDSPLPLNMNSDFDDPYAGLDGLEGLASPNSANYAILNGASGAVGDEDGDPRPMLPPRTRSNRALF